VHCHTLKPLHPPHPPTRPPSAVGLAGSGAVYIGVNLEFPGMPLSQSVHGEQCLMANLLLHGEGALHTLAISAAPCGHCRQFYSELACAVGGRVVAAELLHPGLRLSTSFDPLSIGLKRSPQPTSTPQDSVRFLFGSHDSPKQELYSLKQLLPARFGPLDLLEPGSAPLLLERQSNALSWHPSAARKLGQRAGDALFARAAEAALEAARRVSG
jgi:cytidine deaminase